MSFCEIVYFQTLFLGSNNDNRQLTIIDCISKRATAGLVSAVGCLSLKGYGWDMTGTAIGIGHDRVIDGT